MIAKGIIWSNEHTMICLWTCDFRNKNTFVGIIINVPLETENVTCLRLNERTVPGSTFSVKYIFEKYLTLMMNTFIGLIKQREGILGYITNFWTIFYQRIK